MGLKKILPIYNVVFTTIFYNLTLFKVRNGLKFINILLNFIYVEDLVYFLRLMKDNKNVKLYNSVITVNYTREKFNIYFFKNIFYNIKFIIYTYVYLLFYNVKWLIVAFFISFFYFFLSIYYIQIDFIRQLSMWFIIFVIYYLLISTFNSFLSKYRYGKFTSAIQRFWKRTNMIFWLIEGFLFLLFFYYFLNSSQEPLYFFDYSNLNQELLIPLKTTYKNMIFLSIAIYLSFILIINSNFLNYFQNILILCFTSLIIFYMLYVESYQFVYIITIFGDSVWIFDDIKNIWVLEVEENNLRVKQQYFILCLAAKYWHFIFIFISWYFFLIKSIEISKINYTLLGFNVQNLLILYILNLFCLVQWFKWVFKKFLEIVYYWFHVQYDEKFIIIFKNEFINFFWHFFSIDGCFNYVDKVILISSSLYCSNEINLWKYIKCLKKTMK